MSRRRPVDLLIFGAAIELGFACGFIARQLHRGLEAATRRLRRRPAPGAPPPPPQTRPRPVESVPSLRLVHGHEGETTRLPPPCGAAHRRRDRGHRQ